jgi:hypothetical protein
MRTTWITLCINAGRRNVRSQKALHTSDKFYLIKFKETSQLVPFPIIELAMKPIFFKGAATIAFISAIHHIHRGSSELSAAWRILHPVALRAALTGWSYMSVSYMITSKYL